MTALPSKHYSGCHKATEEEVYQGTPGKEIWRKNVNSGLQIQLEEDGVAVQDRAEWKQVICGLCFT